MDRRATREQTEASGTPTMLEQKAALAAYGTEAGPRDLQLGGRYSFIHIDLDSFLFQSYMIYLEPRGHPNFSS